MKNSMFKISVAVFLAVMCLSCGSDDDGGNPINNETFLTAKVDGVDFEVRGLFATDSKISGVNSTMILAGYENDSKAIGIGIANLKSTGTYKLFGAETDDPEESTYISSFIYSEENTSWAAHHWQVDNAARVTITELNDDYVEGTFNFVGTRIDFIQKDITDGHFKCKRLKVN